MKIERTIRRRPTLFEKGQVKVVFSEVTPADAGELYRALGDLRLRPCGRNDHLELYIQGFSKGHFLFSNSTTSSESTYSILDGYELGMLLNGVDLKGHFHGPFLKLPKLPPSDDDRNAYPKSGLVI